ncbi:MAG: cytochrome c family protein [Phycisphaerales bacterium]|nr:cytochrome c family protein [Phycisphaerales bacterium]
MMWGGVFLMAGSLAMGMAMAASEAPAGDAAAGKSTFRQCMACHAVEQGKNKVGPSLFGVVGRKAASIEGYKYSNPMIESGLTWSQENLMKYLQDPKGTVPGGKMAFAGIKKVEDVKNVIAYLEEQK